MDSHVGHDKMVDDDDDDIQKVDTLLLHVVVDTVADNNPMKADILLAADMKVVGRLLVDRNMIHVVEDKVVLLDTLLCVKTNLSHSTLDHTCFSNCSS
jgi:hypothetical protein